MEMSDKISELRKKHGLTLEQVGDAVGVGKSTVRKWETGDIKNMRRDKIASLAKILHTTPAYLMGWDENPSEIPSEKNFDVFSVPGVMRMPKMVQKPLIGTIACGTPILAEQNIDSYITVPEDIRCDFALRCEGDSMIGAHIMPGASVYIREQPDVENGEIAAVIIDDERATLKRVYKSDGAITLMAENSKYPPIVIAGERLQHVRILGRVVAYTNYLQ